jgi:hypothetical protein
VIDEEIKDTKESKTHVVNDPSPVVLRIVEGVVEFE